MKLSVSIITYNHQDYIEEAIVSVLNQQTDFDFEILVSDDCSTDNTLAVIEKLAKESNKIKVLYREKNVGMVHNAINTISCCKGEYIALLEGDDFWVDELKLQKQVDFLDQNKDIAFCITNGYYVRNGINVGLYYTESNTLPSIFTLDYMIKNNVFIHCNSKMFRKSVQPEIFPESIYKASSWDWALSLMQAEKGNIAYLDFVSLAYRRHENAQINRKYLKENLIHGLALLNDINAHFNLKYNKMLGKRYWHYQELAFIYLEEKEYKIFLLYLIKSFFNKPLRSLNELKDLGWSIKKRLTM